jgi:hypothetical protein
MPGSWDGLISSNSTNFNGGCVVKFFYINELLYRSYTTSNLWLVSKSLFEILSTLTDIDFYVFGGICVFRDKEVLNKILIILKEGRHEIL